MVGGCGGPLPGAQEGEPPALNLAPSGELIGWTVEGAADSDLKAERRRPAPDSL